MTNGNRCHKIADPLLKTSIVPCIFVGHQVFFSPENYPRYVGTERGVIPEYYPKQADGSDLEQQSFTPIGHIPQVEHTYGYLEETYGAVNEKQVGIGESTCSGVFGAIPLGMPNGTALFSVDELTHIAMERADTARDAIQIMGSLAEEHGFYGAGQFEGTAESLAVSDPKEAWVFHILPDPTGKSAIWAAQRIPDNGFAVLANMFVLRELDPTDTENFMMSSSVHSVAKEYQWWDESSGELLDFTKIYSDGEYAHKYYSGRRMWGAYNLACPSKAFPSEYVDLQSDPVYPLWSAPDQLISQQDLFRYHRYAYENTKFDLGAPGNLAGGPFGTPDRWKAGPNEVKVGGNWERAIGLYRTSDSYIVQSRQGASTGAVLWFGPASALGTVFTPFLVGISDVPASFRSGHHSEFSRESAFWAACFAHNIANLKWSYAVKDLKKRQDLLESSSIGLIEEMEIQFQAHQNFSLMEKQLADNAAKVVASLWSLSDEIMFKYASGFVNEVPDGMSQMVGYPEWWLKAVGYEDGPPPPPTEPKCCHPPKPEPHASGDLLVDWAASNEHSLSQPSLTGKAAMRQYLRQTGESDT